MAHGHGAVGLQVQLARHASLGKARVDLAAVGVVGRQAHKRLVCKVLHLAARPGLPARAGGQHGHLVQRQQRHGLHTGGVAACSLRPGQSAGRSSILPAAAILAG